MMANEIANELGNVLIVGGGRMGQAIAAGLLQIDGVSSKSIVIANPGEEKRRAIEEGLGVRTVASAAEGLPARCVILAVKPGVVPQAIASLLEEGIDASTLVISIAAGISTSKLSDLLGMDIPIVRVMPNTPLVCGQGMSAVSGGATASAKECELVRLLFASMGRAVIVDESQQDIVCAVSGSGPAYFELVAELITRTAQEMGMSYETALELTIQTMLGTATLIRQTGQSLPDAIDSVCSPGGTTIAALEAMRANGIEDAIASGVMAAKKRSEELGA